MQRRLEETAPLKRRSDIYAESKIKAELDNEKAQIQKELSDRLATYNGVRRRINAIEKRKTRPPEIQQEYQELLAQEQTQHPIVVHLKARKDELIAARDWIKGEYDATEKDKGNDSAGSGVRHVAWKDGEPYTWEAKDISDSHLF